MNFANIKVTQDYMYEVMISGLILNVFLSVSGKKKKTNLRRGNHMNAENQWKELAMPKSAPQILLQLIT